MSNARTGLRVRLLYIFTFLFLGGFGNYFAIYLKHVGWDDTAVGWQGGLRFLCLSFAPLLWGHLADRTGRTRWVLRILTVGSAVLFLPFLVTTDVGLLLVATLFFCLFRTSMMATSDAFCLTHVERSDDEYGKVRVYGSIGFIVGGFSIGGILSATDREWLPAILECVLIATAVVTLFLPAYRLKPKKQEGLVSAIRRLLKQRHLQRFYVITFVCRLSAQGLYIFLPLHLKDLGVTDAFLPTYWTVGVVSEIILMRNAPRIFGRYRPHRVLALTFFLAAVQYILVALVTDPWLLLPIMLLHGMSFGIWYYTSVTWLGTAVEPTDRARAQGLFSAIGFGLGGMSSSIIAGYIYSDGGGALLFAVAAGATLLTAFAAWLVLEPASDTPT